MHLHAIVNLHLANLILELQKTYSNMTSRVGTLNYLYDFVYAAFPRGRALRLPCGKLLKIRMGCCLYRFKLYAEGNTKYDATENQIWSVLKCRPNGHPLNLRLVVLLGL